MDKVGEGYLSQNDFTTGLLNLFTGNFDVLCESIFKIYDFDKDGKICKQDIEVVLSYIPLNTINEINTNKLHYEK